MATLHVGGGFLRLSPCPHVSRFVAFSKLFTPESVFKSLRPQCAFSPDTCGRRPDP